MLEEWSFFKFIIVLTFSPSFLHTACITHAYNCFSPKDIIFIVLYFMALTFRTFYQFNALKYLNFL